MKISYQNIVNITVFKRGILTMNSKIWFQRYKALISFKG